jgi:hypothetical protein
LATVGLLLLALGQLPRGYFQFLRLAVCAISVHTAYLAYRLSNQQGWVWGFGAVALLFNPLAPVYLNRGIWGPIDVATAMVFFASIFFLPPWTFLKLWWKALGEIEEDEHGHWRPKRPPPPPT